MDPGGEIGGADLVELLAEAEARVALELVAFGAEFADLVAGQFEIAAEAVDLGIPTLREIVARATAVAAPSEPSWPGPLSPPAMVRGRRHRSKQRGSGLAGPVATRAPGCGVFFDRGCRLSPQLVECLVGVGYGLGMGVVGGSTVGDLLPVGPGEHPLDREYLGGSQACLDAFTEGVRQCLLVLELVPREPCRQARCGEHQPMERHHLGMIVEAGDGVVPIEAGPEVSVQRRHRFDAGPAVTYDACCLALVIRKPVQHQVFLGGEVPEEGRLGDLGRRGDVVDRDAVEAALQEQRDGRVADGVARLLLLAGPQSRRLAHLATVTFMTGLLF